MIAITAPSKAKTQPKRFHSARRPSRFNGRAGPLGGVSGCARSPVRALSPASRLNPNLHLCTAFGAAGSSEKIPPELAEVLQEAATTGKCRHARTRRGSP